jgi:cellulose synthase/poly-beta-1,6-N-acetylglucosamine synthase-like glycosyltransferase
VLQTRLNTGDVAATGHIQSLKGGWISRYRTYEYTLGLEILRRIQAFFGVIPVIPGPTSVFRTDVLDQLDFKTDSLTEDMDITLQIHRKKLGHIAYIPEAKTYTQDPKDLSDYIKQISRWYRGNFQVMQRHKIGRRPQRIDVYMSYVMLEQWILIAGLIIFPFMAWWSQNYAPLAIMFLNDFIIFLALTIWAAAKNDRSDVIAAFPLFYVLRFVSMYIFIRSWYEIVVQRKFRTAQPGWSTAGRRYRIVTDVVANKI